MIKTRNVFKKVLHAAAVLAMLTGTIAVAHAQQVGAVGLPIDRGVHAEAGGYGAGASGGKSQPRNGPASSWAPTQNGAGVTGNAPRLSGASQPGRAQEQASSDQEEAKQGEPKRAGAKKEGHPAGKGVGAGKESASNFGASSTSAKSKFGFSGKLQSSGGHNEIERKRAAERKFAKETQAQSTPGVRSSKKRRHGKRSSPKLSEPAEPKGEAECDQGSSLQLCTWL
jgi:hypothetical protein